MLTTEKIIQIATMYRAGDTYKKIAEAVGCSMPTIVTTLKKLRDDGIDLPQRASKTAYQEALKKLT